MQRGERFFPLLAVHEKYIQLKNSGKTLRILYGIQGTGNGHITRARTMSRAFSETELEVDYLVSGRSPDKLFDMEPFGDFCCLRGMTMIQNRGKVNYFKTAFTNNPLVFRKEIKALDLSAYDLVISDFEPVSAWAAKKANKKTLGLSHQYSFKYPIPMAGKNIASNLVMKYFAPTNVSLGVHWHHFNQPILPPLIEPPSYPVEHNEGRVLVYLPFEEQKQVVEWLNRIDGQEFIYYCPLKEKIEHGNVTLYPLSRDGFQKDLASCGGVICNAGFGLMSEAIQAGKKLLIKPVAGQMEQLSNAAAAKQLSLAEVLEEGFREEISASLRSWFDQPNREPKPYPDVAKGIVQWIQEGMRLSERELSQSLWSQY